MFNNFSKSIFIRIMCSVFAALLIGVVCIFTGSYIIEKESLNNLNYLTEKNSYKIEAPLEVMEKTIENLSYILSNIASTKKVEDDFSDIEQLDNIIKRFSNSHNDLIGIYIYLAPEYSFNKKHNTYFYAKSSRNGTLQSQKVEKDKDDYLKTLLIDDKTINNYNEFLKLAKNDYEVLLNYMSYIKPIVLNNTIIGFTVVSIEIEDLIKSLPNLKVYKKGYTFLLDNCNCLMESNKKGEDPKKFKENNKAVLNLLKDKIKKEKNGIINYKQNNIEMILCFAQIKNDFTYVITVPKDEVFQQKYQLQRLIAGIIIMGIFAVILIVLNI